MPRSIRIVAISFVSLVVLLIITATIIAHKINPNDYKPQIISSVNKATGRQLSINGDISLSFFPWLGVNIQQVVLSNPAGFGDQPFATVGEAEVRLHLLPLLVGKLELGTIVLNDADLNFIKNATGNNWSNFSATTPEPSAPAANTSKSNSNSFKEFDITNISIHNTNLHYTDLSTQEKIDLTQVNFDSSSIGTKKFFPINMSFNVTSKKPVLALQFNGSAEAYFDPDEQLYQLKSLKSNGQFSTASAKNLSFGASGDASVDLTKQTWSADKLVANLGELALKLSSEGNLKDMSGSGTVKIDSFNAKNLIEALKPGMKFANADALNSVGTEFKFTMGDGTIKVPNFTATLDQTHIKGDLLYTYKNNRSLNFDLTLDKLNVDQYETLYKANKANIPGETKPAANSASNGVLPLDFLKNLEAQGKFQATQLTVNQIALKNVLVKMSSHANIVNLNPISASVYQGSANGQVTINLKSATPAISSNIALSNLNLAQASSKMSGKLSLKAQVNTSGNTMPAWMGNMQGNGSLSMMKGVLNGIDINFWLKQGIAVLNARVPPLSGNTHQTAFDDMNANFTIRNGVLSNQDLLIASSDFSAKGAGTINLANQGISYRLFATLNTDKKWVIPILITGSLESPKVQLDMANLTKSIVKNEVKSALTGGGIKGTAGVVGGILSKMLP